MGPRRGILLLILVMLASLGLGVSCWTAVVPRLIAGIGPKTWMEWLAVCVLSALPFSVPPAVIGLLQRAGWAPGAVLVWGVLWVAELALTLAAAGSFAGLSGPEWFVPWTAIIGAALALAGIVRYVGRVVSESPEPKPQG